MLLFPLSPYTSASACLPSLSGVDLGSPVLRPVFRPPGAALALALLSYGAVVALGVLANLVVVSAATKRGFSNRRRRRQQGRRRRGRQSH